MLASVQTSRRSFQTHFATETLSSMKFPPLTLQAAPLTITCVRASLNHLRSSRNYGFTVLLVEIVLRSDVTGSPTPVMS